MPRANNMPFPPTFSLNLMELDDGETLSYDISYKRICIYFAQLRQHQVNTIGVVYEILYSSDDAFISRNIYRFSSCVCFCQK